MSTRTGIGRLAARDLAASTGLRTLPHIGLVDRALAGVSRVTDHAAGWYALGALGAVVDPRRRPSWVAATLTVAATERVSVLVKRRVGRGRPHLRGLPHLASTPSALSFPSSHTANAVAAVLSFGELLPVRPLALLAAMTGVSRPYLGVHYVSDVVGGVALGTSTGLVGRAVMRRLAGHYEPRIVSGTKASRAAACVATTTNSAVAGECA